MPLCSSTTVHHPSRYSGTYRSWMRQPLTPTKCALAVIRRYMRVVAGIGIHLLPYQLWVEGDSACLLPTSPHY